MVTHKLHSNFILLNDYSPKWKWIIFFLVYTSRNCFHVYLFNFIKQFYGTSACHPLIICKQNLLNSSWVPLLLKSKRNTYLLVIYPQISLLFVNCLARRLRLFKKKSSFVSETKRAAILFCSEVSSAWYSEMEKPIRWRKKHYPPRSICQ